MQLDVIGDVHGHADALDVLLRKLGYTFRAGAWRAPEGRHAVFVGDYIDGGPSNLRVIEIVREMREAGVATPLMGNHELNALQYHSVGADGRPLRAHSAKNIEQHRTYLNEVAQAPDAHKDAIRFFLSLPLWLETNDIRVIHACWSEHHLTEARKLLDGGSRLEHDDLRRTVKGGDLYEPIETLLKSPEALLPHGMSFQDKYGHCRREVRLAWWRHNARKWRDLALLEPDLLKQLPDEHPKPFDLPIYKEDAPPVFFGHYRLRSEPTALGQNTVCVDFSGHRGDQLTAFRQHGPGCVGEFITTGRI